MSRVHTKLVYRLIDDAYILVHEEGFYYYGPVGFAKGDSTAKAQEQQQLQFNTQLMSIFQQQFSKQSQLLDWMKGQLQPIITDSEKGKGYSDEALAAMRTGATDQISTAYDNAQKALQNKEFTQGGRDLPSGVNQQLDAALLNAEAQDKAGSQNTITLNNANLANTNLWNAFNVLSGNVASQYNPTGYAGAYNQGSGNVANLSQAVTASQQSGLMGALGGLAGGVMGAAGSAGGFGKLFCYVAASFWGWESAKTRLIRLWMAAKAPKFFRNFYIKHGKWISETPIRWAYRPVFECIVRFA